MAGQNQMPLAQHQQEDAQNVKGEDEKQQEDQNKPQEQ